MKKVFEAFWLSIWLILASNAYGEELTYKIGLYEFNVPEEYIPDLSPWGRVKSILGLDQDVSSFIFEFSGESVNTAIEEYVSEDNSIDQKVIGAVYLIDSQERRKSSDPRDFYDIWHATNGFENREVVLYEEGYYFVFERKGYRGMFYVFSKPPVSSLPKSKHDFFVAICSGSSVVELKHVECTSQFLFKDDLMIEFSVSLANLKVQPQVVSFLQKRFAEWLQ